MIRSVDPLDEAPGIAVPATRRAVRRRLLAFGAVVAAGVALLMVAVVVAVGLSRTTSAIDDGVARTAVVVDVASRPANARSNRDGTVTVELSQDGATRRAAINVYRVDEYHEGQRVDVRYAPGDPSHVAIVGEDPVTPGVPALALGAFGVLVTLIGVTALRHVGQARRVLRRHEWLATPATVRALPFEVGMRQRSLRVVIVQDPAEHRAVSAEPVGLRRLPDEVAPMAWVAGLGEPRFVVAPPGGGRVVLVEQLKRRRRRPVQADDDPHARRISRRYHLGAGTGSDANTGTDDDLHLRDR